VIRALVVDDEPLARLRLRQLLQEAGDVEIADCASGAEALGTLKRWQPDVLFLDVQMPEMNGFSILDQLDPGRMPIVVFATAYDHYALRAFEKCALDYLMKPFDTDRFAMTMERVRKQLSRSRSARRPLFFVVGQAGGVRIVAARDVDWIGAAGNYVELHIGTEVLLNRESMRAIEARMRGKMLRVHRSAMVNIDKVDGLQWSTHGDGKAVLKDGRLVPISRRYSSAIRQAFSPVHGSQSPA
jgi:two-component system, LytTR family, response regulator